MNKEAATKKSQEISKSDRTSLSVITLVHHRFGLREGTDLPLSYARLRYLLYLSEIEWHRIHRTTYLGNWIYANNGPLLEGFGGVLAHLDGMELVETSNLYTRGIFNRFSSQKLDPTFENILINIKHQYYFMGDTNIKNLVYASEPMQNVSLGDYLFN